MDIKKLGNIPDGGGWRTRGRRAGGRNSRATTTRRRGNHPVFGYGYLHTALDDYSRLAYTEILPDERKQTATAFWTRAYAFFAEAGVTVRRVLTDNGSPYRSRLWRDAPHRRRHQPQTHPPVPATDQRQSRTLLPHPGVRRRSA